MTAEVRDHLRSRADLPASEISWLMDLGERRCLRRGETFCSIGQTNHEYGILETGSIQVYSLSIDGEKAVLDFIFPGGGVLALEAALRGGSSRVCIEAIERCEIMVWPFKLRETSRERHPGWEQLERRLIEDAFIRKQQRYDALSLTARERFGRLATELPAGWTELPQHLLASYLQITPQYLCRLKRTVPAERVRQASTTI